MARFKDFATLTVRVAVVSALLSVAFVADGKNLIYNGLAAKTTLTDSIKEKETIKENIVYVGPCKWKNPEFPGGERALYNYILDVMIYPPEALKDSIQGRVIVEFVIDETGKVTNARVVRPLHPALDKEALRIVNSMPRWSSGIREGLPSKITFHMPIPFYLKDQCQDKK